MYSTLPYWIEYPPLTKTPYALHKPGLAAVKALTVTAGNVMRGGGSPIKLNWSRIAV